MIRQNTLPGFKRVAAPAARQATIPGIGGILPGELIVDGFCGGGGMSQAIEEALGRPPDIGMNHSKLALDTHRINHPFTRHYLANILDVDPHEACGGMPVGLAHFSPDCTHFSQARGAKPVSKQIRSLAWVVVKWAAAVYPRVITMENVPEFLGWGPCIWVWRWDKKANCLKRVLVPDPRRKGKTYREFISQMAALGYPHREFIIRSGRHGGHTTRKRLFIAFRRDGVPMDGDLVPTHGPGTSREENGCHSKLDFTLPCPSVFLNKRQGRKLGVKRPLAAKTMARIAHGLMRYVVNCEDPRGPFIVRLGQYGGNGTYTQGIDKPLSTVTTKAEHCLVTPNLVTTGYGEREGQAPRTMSVRSPLGTVVGKSKHALVAAWLAKHNGGKIGAVGQDVREALHTITAKDTKAMLACSLTKFYGTSKGASLREPLPTVTGGAGGGHMGLVAALIVHYYGKGTTAQDLRDPLHTIVAKARHGLVTVVIDGETWAIVDVGMRMLTPKELAGCQGFRDGYQLLGTIADQVHLIGNSVSPPAGRALLRYLFKNEIQAAKPQRRRRAVAA